MKKTVGQVIETDVFKEGDIICSKTNIEAGFPLYFRATPDDVEGYSGKGHLYYVLIHKPVETKQNQNKNEKIS